MLIRTAKPADIPTLIHLASQAKTSVQWSYEQYEQAIHSPQPRRIAVVLEEQSKIQGFLIGQAIDREWELENIVVASATQRRGLGSHLLNYFLDLVRCEHAESVFLEVRESNHAARGFYGKFAFQQIGRRAKYYTNPSEDALTFRLRST